MMRRKTWNFTWEKGMGGSREERGSHVDASIFMKTSYARDGPSIN
jgi:hypothetical protein